MSTPSEPLPQNTYPAFAVEPPAPSTIDPDNPPWGVGAAAFVWLASVAVLMVLPLIGVISYALYHHNTAVFGDLARGVPTDQNVIVILIAAVVPSHVITLAIVWAIVTGLGKRPFGQTIGWGWSPRFGFWTSVALAVALLLFGGMLAYFFGGEKTQFDQMIESSTPARFATAFLATVTAPLVEELVYRGVLYPALQRLIGVLWAVVVVASLFTLVHVSQYSNNYGVIAAVATLSFAVTYVRARTGRLLPCFIIHLVFNGLQVAGLVYEYFRPLNPIS